MKVFPEKVNAFLSTIIKMPSCERKEINPSFDTEFERLFELYEIFIQTLKKKE